MVGIVYTSLRRLVEILVWDVILSALIFGLFKAGVIPSTMSACFLSLLLGAILFAVQNIRWMRRCRFEMPDKRTYYIVNYSAYAVFMLVSFIILALCDSETYTWVFAITKFLKYTKLALSTFTAAMVFHMLMLFIIWAAPFGMEEMLADAAKVSWQERSYPANVIIGVINSEILNIPQAVRKTMFMNIFTDASNNDVNRLVGLPVEDEEEIWE